MTKTTNKYSNFPLIDRAIAALNWDSAALTELDNLINDIENGRKHFKRFPLAAARGFRQGGRANEAASLLLATRKSTNCETPLSVSARYERDKREQPVQERIIESWAKAVGIWHDNLYTIDGKEQIAEGGEAKVFSNGSGILTKLLSTEYFITPQFALDRITLHNTLFPAANMKITGFGRNSLGEFQFIVEQPFIQGGHVSYSEICEYMTKAGFSKTNQDRGNTYITKYLYASDLHDENVLKTANGNLIVIDADVRWNTAELFRGGEYVIDNSIIQTSEKYSA